MGLLFIIFILQFPFFICFSHREILEFIGRQNFKAIFGKDVEDLTYELVTPIKKYQHGHYLYKYKRDSHHSDEHHFSIEAFGNNFEMVLRKNKDLISSDAKFSLRSDNEILNDFNADFVKNCLYHGQLISHGNTPVAISTCNGLNGLIRTRDADYFIQKLPDKFNLKGKDDHIIFKRSHDGFCGTDKNMIAMPTKFSLLNSTRFSRYAAPNAYYGNQIIVETAIFMDLALFEHLKKIYEWDTEEHTVNYIMAIVNAIQLIYNDGSLTDKPIKFIIIKTEIFKSNQVGFHISPDSSLFLDNFCKWQNQINIPDDNDHRHWDHALMFTGVDIHLDGKYTVAGVASVGGMCNGPFSCTLSEAIGLSSIFIAAHESGHNFGIMHDGDGNSCDNRQFMMSPTVQQYPHRWSPCSKDQFKTFLLSPQTVCLLDIRKPEPYLDHEKDYNILFGQRFDSDIQCQLQFGHDYLRDRTQYGEAMCNKLSCTNGFETKQGIAAYDGTPCGDNLWCQKSICQPKSRSVVEPMRGHWAPYNELVKCRSGCTDGGAGIAIHMRDCKSNIDGNYTAKCDGPRVMFEKCIDNTLCPKRQSVSELAGKVCDKLRPVIPNLTGRGVQADNSDTCYIYCESTTNGYVQTPAIFPDGTPCGRNKYCLLNYCTNFACQDVVVDSDKLTSC